MRFIGSKKAILDDINALIVTKGIKAKSLCDIFSGTTCVATYFKKKGYSVVSNVLLYFSYVLQKAYIENNINPKFNKLIQKLKPKLKIRHWTQFTCLYLVINFLNNLRGVEGFIYKNYSDEGTKSGDINRKYLTGENTKIDAILLRNKLDDNHNKQIKLTDAYLKNLFSEDVYRDKIKALRGEEEDIKKLLAGYELREIGSERSEGCLNRVKDFLEGYDDGLTKVGFEQKRQMAGLLFLFFPPLIFCFQNQEENHNVKRINKL
jgi:hypothetical protein